MTSTIVQSNGVVRENHINQKVGMILRHWRQKKHMSAEQLALKTAGKVSSRQIRRIESGQGSTTYETFYHLRKALDLSPAQMWLPFLVEEDTVPLFSAHPLPQANYLAINFFPGKTICRYSLQNDPEQYACVLEQNLGVLGAGSILHISPNGEIRNGNLALGFRTDGSTKLFRMGSDMEFQISSRHPNLKMHRVILIVPA